MPTALTFLILLLLLLPEKIASGGASPAEAPQPTPSLNGDLSALLSFKGSLSSTARVLASWQAENGSVCSSFAGVACRAGRVSAVELDGLILNAEFQAVADYLLPLDELQSLSLSSSNLSGNIAGELRCGESLSFLDLSGNLLRGSVSGVISLAASCSALKSLNLSNNYFGDSASDRVLKSGEAASALEVVDLSTNKISGEESLLMLLNLSHLQYLDLSFNFLAGNLPPIVNCSALHHLDLSSNSLDGQIFTGVLSTCGNLEYLNLSSNHFSGLLPSDLSSCVSLSFLSLSNNNFSGELPFDYLPTTNLRIVELAFNQFSGGIPKSLTKLAMLESIDLSSNSLSGFIPPALCYSPGGFGLKELYLQDNLLSGEVPASLSNCTQLVSLDLSFNYLTGSIPASLGSLSRLQDLIMWQNQLVGEIPSELSQARALENLILDNNEISGEIPAALMNCTNLNWISLSGNNLSGKIPPWIGKLPNLAILKLGNNSFSGEIPLELGDCKSLIWLDLNSNLLIGSIPQTLSRQSGNIAVGLVTGKRYVYLKNDGSGECHGSGNLLEFAGIRPEELSRLPTRRSCNFTRVYMGSTRYTFNNNGSMIFLDLSYNQLSGSIPKELGAMYYLMILNLGHNSLSGEIPSELGYLRYVAVLDLSHNDLQGPIPGSFSGLAMLAEMDLSNNELNGTIPELGQLATFPRSRYANNSGLCGFPLPPCEMHSRANSTDQQYKSRRRQASLAGSVALGLLFSLFCIFGFIVLVESKKRQRNKDGSTVSSRDVFIDSFSHSGMVTGNSNAWKLTSAKEALSISLATFESKAPLRDLTFADLLDATNGFHDNSLVGSGGFGDVYKAQLKDGTIVAIKKLKQVSGQGDREFTAEMETIGRIKHRNLVPLLGYCKVADERLLIYDFMKHGSLEDVLLDRNKSGSKLSWASRRKIAVGAARGLAFLHHNCIPHIIHRDMKSSNVLLDENLEARVSDFGMARLMNTIDTHLSVSTLAGTPGYVPPEYYQSFRCTTKGDVYSYGVILLELLTGKPPTDSPDFGENNNLVGWVKQNAKPKICQVFDPSLLKDDPSLELELLEHLKVACACLDDRPSRRPTMLKVMAMFKEIQAGGSTAATDINAVSFSTIAGMTNLKEAKEEKD